MSELKPSLPSQEDRMYEAAANLCQSHERQLVEIAAVFGKDARNHGTIAEMVRQEVAALRADLKAAADSAAYEGQWSAHESERHAELRAAVTTSLQQLDELAELWGDEGKFRAARDRLRKALNGGTA